MLLELLGRNIATLDIRIASIFLVLAILSLFSLQPQWITTNQILASLPIQRFKWKSEVFLSSAFNRTFSLISTSLAFSIFIYSHYNQPDMIDVQLLNTSFLQLFIIVAILFVIKLGGMKVFFALHQEDKTGTMVIDYQYAFNQLIALVLCVVICLDVFFFKLNNPFYLTVSVIIGLLYLARMFGNIILLLNEFQYPIVSLFIYLCAFEILPMLIIAKVLFVNS